MTTDIARIVDVPIPCPACGKEFTKKVGWLVGRASVTCEHCRADLDVSSGEFPAYLKPFVELCREQQVVFEKLAQLAKRSRKPPVD